MNLTRNHFDVSHITWEDILDKVTNDFSSNDFVIVGDGLPTFVLKSNKFPTSIKVLLDEVGFGLDNADLYVSFARKSRSHGKHYDFYDLILIQLKGKMRYFIEDEPCEILPGDSLYLPAGTYHEPLVVDRRATLSVAMKTKHDRIPRSELEKLIKYMEKLGMDKVQHKDDSLLQHSINVANMVMEYGRGIDEQKAALFHSVYGTEFQFYKLSIDREEIQNLIGTYSEQIVHTFCTIPERTNKILYGIGIDEPLKTSLRWLEYCNIKDQYPNVEVLKEFELVLGLKEKKNDHSKMQRM